MYARSSTFSGRPDGINGGIEFLKNEVAPLLNGIDGCLGLSLLVNRATGQAIATSSWSTQSAMQQSAEQVRAARDRGTELFGGSAQIDEWEIAVMHRTQHGEACRVSWAKGDMDRMEDVFRMGVLPSLDTTDGFCGASLLVNRATGIGCVTTAWETTSAMLASRPTADSLRARAVSDSNGEVINVTEFELAYAHLHVPELV